MTLRKGNGPSHQPQKRHTRTEESIHLELKYSHHLGNGPIVVSFFSVLYFCIQSTNNSKASLFRSSLQMDFPFSSNIPRLSEKRSKSIFYSLLMCGIFIPYIYHFDALHFEFQSPNMIWFLKGKKDVHLFVWIVHEHTHITNTHTQQTHMDEGKLYWSNIYILEFSNFQWTKKRRTKTQQQRLIFKLIVEYVDSLSAKREKSNIRMNWWSMLLRILLFSGKNIQTHTHLRNVDRKY